MAKTNQLSKSIVNLWFVYEPYVFGAVLLLNTLPVLLVQYFYTGDGPSHSYNANIIASLLTDNESAFSSFYHLRLALIPNMGGHTLLVLLQLVSDPWMAEKAVYLLCLILLPLSFRYAVKSITKAPSPLVYIIFLLVHHFCFYIGFQSFTLGLAMLFYTLGFAIRKQDETNVKTTLTLSVLLFTTAYFHLFAAAVALIAMALMHIIDVYNNTENSKKSLISFVTAATPTALFILHFLHDKSSGQGAIVFDLSDKIASLFSMVFIAINVEQEAYLKALLAIVFFSALAGALAFRLNQKNNLPQADFALNTSLLLIALYIVLPDKMASGGFVSIRLLLSALLLLAFLLTVNNSINTFSLAVGILCIGLSLVRLPSLIGNAKALSKDAMEMAEIIPQIPHGSTLVPLNYSDHWLHYNMGLLPGALSEVVVLDNYEASTNHFPVMWDERIYSDQSLGDIYSSTRPRLYVSRYEEATGIDINAVIRWMHNDSMQDEATLHTDSVLNSLFNLAYVSTSGHVELYLRKEEAK